MNRLRVNDHQKLSLAICMFKNTNNYTFNTNFGFHHYNSRLSYFSPQSHIRATKIGLQFLISWRAQYPKIQTWAQEDLNWYVLTSFCSHPEVITRAVGVWVQSAPRWLHGELCQESNIVHQLRWRYGAVRRAACARSAVRLCLYKVMLISQTVFACRDILRQILYFSISWCINCSFSISWCINYSLNSINCFSFSLLI